MASQVVELISQHWQNVGIASSVKEVTPDEYRTAQSSNKLDAMLWKKGLPLSIVLGNGKFFTPPFDDYFTMRNGMLWAEWVDSNGEKGIEPPAYVKQMMKDIAAFQSAPVGSDKSNELGAALTRNMVENLLFIGTVSAPNPIYRRNALKNVTEFKTWSYEYYRT